MRYIATDLDISGRFTVFSLLFGHEQEPLHVGLLLRARRGLFPHMKRCRVVDEELLAAQNAVAAG